MQMKKTNRATEMRQAKKLIYIFKISGFIIGGVTGCFIGYQFGELSDTAASYGRVSTLSFFLSLLGGSIGCVVGFAIATSIGQKNIHR
jgi:acetyl-CoA carboxylase beta subunit